MLATRLLIVVWNVWFVNETWIPLARGEQWFCHGCETIPTSFWWLQVALAAVVTITALGLSITRRWWLRVVGIAVGLFGPAVHFLVLLLALPGPMAEIISGTR